MEDPCSGVWVKAGGPTRSADRSSVPPIVPGIGLAIRALRAHDPSGADAGSRALALLGKTNIPVALADWQAFLPPPGY